MLYTKEELRKRRRRNKELVRSYNITIGEYEEFRDFCEGRCSICGELEYEIHPKSKKPRPLSVDHCHKTGVIRGLLCNRCNQGLGLFRDNPLFLRAAVRYLRRFRQALKDQNEK